MTATVTKSDQRFEHSDYAIDVVPVAAMQRAFKAAGAALTTNPIEAPASDSDEGVYLTNHPMNRMATAVVDAGTSEDQSSALLARFMAALEVMGLPCADKHVKGFVLSAAFIKAAATSTCMSKGGFNRDQFASALNTNRKVSS